MQISKMLKHEKHVCLNLENKEPAEEKSAITCCSNEITKNQN